MTHNCEARRNVVISGKKRPGKARSFMYEVLPPLARLLVNRTVRACCPSETAMLPPGSTPFSQALVQQGQ